MAVLACLQMEAFVLPAGMGLWINVLTNTSIKQISAHTAIYQAIYITSVIVSTHPIHCALDDTDRSFSPAVDTVDCYGKPSRLLRTSPPKPVFATVRAGTPSEEN